MAVSETKRGFGPVVWTLIVLGIGLAAGVVLGFIERPLRPGPPPGGDRFELFMDVDIVLSTVGVAFLVALLWVYTRTYRETRAKFALGLLVVLAALLFQSVFASPLFFGAFGHHLGGLGPFALIADAFKATAFGAFLYLSLQ